MAPAMIAGWRASTDPAPPSRRIRLTGRAINALVAHAPFTWPLLRGFSHRYWQAQAASWDQRVRPARDQRTSPRSPRRCCTSGRRPSGPSTSAPDSATGALLIAREFPRARVRGVDLSEEMIRRAQGRIGLDPEGRVAFKVADASALPFDDDSFDLVAQLNMPPFFAEIARVLRPGGFAVVAASWGDAPPSTRPTRCSRADSARPASTRSSAARRREGTYFVARRAS